MNTLDIANAITQDDIKKARLLHFSYNADANLDGLKGDVDAVCRKKEIPSSLIDTVFALTYARLNEVK